MAGAEDLAWSLRGLAERGAAGADALRAAQVMATVAERRVDKFEREAAEAAARDPAAAAAAGAVLPPRASLASPGLYALLADSLATMARLRREAEGEAAGPAGAVAAVAAAAAASQPRVVAIPPKPVTHPCSVQVSGARFVALAFAGGGGRKDELALVVRR